MLGMNRRAVNATDEADLDEYEADVVDDDPADVYEDDEIYDEAPGAPRSLGLILTIGGILGFIGAFVLTIERIEMLLDSSYLPTCSIDSVLQCSTVMTSSQASVFGFPNPLIGVFAFPLVILTGVLVLARVALPSWYWLWFLVGTTYGLLFVGWLIPQSLYEIRALCPYCMVVWACVIPIFWRTLAYTLAGGHFGERVAGNALVRVIGRWWWVLTLVTYAVVLTLVLTAFPYYFF